MGWTANTQALSNINIVQNFRDFLCKNKVYIIKNGNLITSNIQAVIISIKELVQTETEIIYQLWKPRTNLYSLESNFNLY